MWFLQTVTSLLGILSHCGGLTTVSWLTNLTNTSQISFPPWIQTNFLLNYPSDMAGHKQFSQRQLNEISCLSYLVSLSHVNQSDCSIKLFLADHIFSIVISLLWGFPEGSCLPLKEGRLCSFPKINKRQLLDRDVLAVPAQPVALQSHEIWKHLKAMILDTALIRLCICGKCSSVDKQPNRMLKKWIFLSPSPFISLIADSSFSTMLMCLPEFALCKLQENYSDVCAVWA